MRYTHQGFRMGKYSYNELKKAAQARRRIGGYEGMDVYACSARIYDPPVHSKGYYVLYDDDNKLVRGYTVHGTIDENGNLDVWKVKGHWSPAVTRNSESKTRSVSASAYSAVVAQAEGNEVGEPLSSDSWFTKLDREINELLSSAKIMEYKINFEV